MCEETSACVVCILCGVVYGGTYMWLDGVFSVLSVYSGVHVLCSGLQVDILFSRYPVSGFTCV
jgi:hypothetical protein